MKKLEKLTLGELKGLIPELDRNDSGNIKGGEGHWVMSAETGWEWTYMLDGVTVSSAGTSGNSAGTSGNSYGSSDNSTGSSTDSGAWYGNFLGPGSDADPFTLGYKPVNQLDSAAFNHDVAYYLNNTGGALGAAFNLNVADADNQLAFDSFMAAINSNNDLKQRIVAAGTAQLFAIIGAYKAGANFVLNW